jgi:hypothetical protein
MKVINKKYTLTVLLSLGLTAAVFAQVAEDALLISRSLPAGTARFQGFGGAGVALGGDISSAYLNPAGLGFYNRSQAVLTPGFQYVGANSRFLGNSSENFNTNFNIANFGVVINNTKDDIIPADYRGGSFAITYNQTNTYNYDYVYGPGENSFSILDEFALQAEGIPSSELDQNAANDNFPGYIDAAFFNYLINPRPNGVEYVASIPVGTLSRQEGSVEEMGRQSQWNFAYGGNFKDKVYFGASIGFKNFSYQKNSRFIEVPVYTDQYIDDVEAGFPYFPVDDQFSVNFVDEVILDEELRIDGSGVNASLGVTYRPVNELTLGLSYVTRTFYSLTEEYFFDLESSVRGIQETDDSEPFDVVDERIPGNRNFAEYTLSTPSRVSGGFAYFFEKYGFLTADVEYVNYANNTFNSNDFNTGSVNENIDQILKSVVNYKVGGEFRYDIFRLRAGYAMYADPTQYVNDNLSRDRSILSGGVGISTPKFFADLAVSRTQFETDFFPYQGAQFFEGGLPQAENNITNVILSLGFNF